MCHLVLFMPIMGLPVFWLMPLRFALPVYVIILAVSGLLFWYVIRAHRQQPVTGAEGLIGARAEVISVSSSPRHAEYLVRSQGELWNARSPDPLVPGETVSVTSVNRLRLVVKRSPSASTGESTANK